MAIMAEDPIVTARATYVIEAKTLAAIGATVAKFLTRYGKARAFPGTTAKEAFAIQIGRRETITSQDILDGRRRLAVRFAPAARATGLVLQFEQQLATN